MINFPQKSLEALIAQGKSVKFFINDRGRFDYIIDLAKLPDYFNKEKLVNNSHRGEWVLAYTVMKMYEHGLKIFKMENTDFQALENMIISLTWPDYEQPYESMTIIPPKEYREHRCLGSHKISFVTIVHEKEIGCLFALVTYDDTRTHTQVIRFNENDVIERWFSDYEEIEGYNTIESRNTTTEEAKFITNIVRACLNAILIIDEIGEKGLKRTEKKGWKKGERETVYEFNQTVKLYDVEHLPITTQEITNHKSGYTVKVHWRRGHWRIQRYGKGRSERKRIRIKPTMVNKRFFAGEETNIATSYEVNKR